MRLRLKEDPREFRRFVWGSSVVLTLAVALLTWRKVVTWPWAAGILGGLAVASAAAAIRPAWFRQPYRLGMRVSHVMGLVFGTIFLTLFFLLVLTPLGWLLRLAGKDLLRLKHDRRDTYWQPSKPAGPIDRAF